MSRKALGLKAAHTISTLRRMKKGFNGTKLTLLSASLP